ncbi:MAG: hypothetical protein IT495_15165 [Gammaproteobacteria bacterium]|nr:hypothetical protein [Gammaproteobacteria bacterium]
MSTAAWMLLTIPGAVLAAIVLAKAVAELIGCAAHVIAVLPLCASQRVSIAEPGAVLVSIQGHDATLPAELGFRLHDAGGAEVTAAALRLRPPAVRGRRRRAVMARFRVPAPGEYRLDVDGLGTQPGAYAAHLVVGHDERLRELELVLLIVLAAAVLATCVAVLVTGLAPPSAHVA